MTGENPPGQPTKAEQEKVLYADIAVYMQSIVQRAVALGTPLSCVQRAVEREIFEATEKQLAA